MRRLCLTCVLFLASLLLVSCSRNKQSASGGPQCFAVEGDTSEGEVRVMVRNTPWGDKTARVHYRVASSSQIHDPLGGFAGGGREMSSLSSEDGNTQGTDYLYRPDGTREKAFITLYVGKMEPRIKITYHYIEGAESVTVDGQPVSVCSGATAVPRIPTPAPASPAAAANVNAAPTPPRLIRLTTPQLEALATKKVQPAYSAVAKSAKQEGSVVVEVMLGEDGKVRLARAISGRPLLSPLAESAVRQWEFKPARSDGKPVGAVGHLIFKFKLP
jgi:TonB family protein